MSFRFWPPGLAIRYDSHMPRPWLCNGAINYVGCMFNIRSSNVNSCNNGNGNRTKAGPPARGTMSNWRYNATSYSCIYTARGSAVCTVINIEEDLKGVWRGELSAILTQADSPDVDLEVHHG